MLLRPKTYHIKPFTGRTLHRLLIQMQNISLQSSGICRKQNFEIVFGLLLSLFPSFFAFLASFFSLVGHLLGYILLGKAFSGRRDVGPHRHLWAAQGQMG